ncbi:MAG: hypothetical protein KTV68_14890 [Acidimicrobiia bacterium]|nr:hypothetical protein [Acidimicrobiia bacterium]
MIAACCDGGELAWWRVVTPVVAAALGDLVGSDPARVIAACCDGGELALDCGDIDKARWAAEKGLSIVDGQEAMCRMKMKAASDAGDHDGVNAAFREAQRAAESNGYDDEVQPETQELYDEMTSSLRSGSPASEAES